MTQIKILENYLSLEMRSEIFLILKNSKRIAQIKISL